MKPHIKRVRGLWYCVFRGSKWYGLGYTPAMAYEDWLMLEIKA